MVALLPSKISYLDSLDVNTKHLVTIYGHELGFHVSRSFSDMLAPKITYDLGDLMLNKVILPLISQTMKHF